MSLSTSGPYPLGDTPLGADISDIEGTWELPEDPKGHLSALESRLTEAQSAKRTIETRWDSAQKYYDGDWATHWNGFEFKPEWTKADAITLNLFKQTINVILPVLLGSQPTIYVSAQNPDEDEVAMQVQDYIQGVAYENDIQKDLVRVYRNAMVRGFGCMKVFWDKTWFRTATPFSDDMAQGRARLCYLNPYSVFPDPNAEKVEDCQYIFFRNTYDAGMLEQVYPWADRRHMDREDTQDRRRTFGQSPQLGDPRYQVWECYHEYGAKLTIYSGQEIIWHGENPTPFLQFPIVTFTPEERDEDIYGTSWWDGGGRDLHRNINYWLWKINCHMHLAGNPQYLHIGAGSLVPATDPGGVWTIKNGTPQSSALTPLNIGDLPGYSMGMLDFYLSRWQLLTGVTPSAQGAREPGIRSGIQQAQAIESSQTVIQNAVGSFALSLAKGAQMLLDMITAHGEGNMSSSQVMGEKAVSSSVNVEDLRHVDGEPHRFQVLIGPNSDMPMSQDMLNQLTMAFTPLGIVDPEGALMATRYPYRNGILKRQREAALQNAAQAGTEASVAQMQHQLAMQQQQEQLAGQQEQYEQMPVEQEAPPE